jgi:signal transduction histidine kinase/tetratricopeptide (TPR) repeat protein
MRRFAFLLALFFLGLGASLQAQRYDEDVQRLSGMPMDSARVQTLNRISEALVRDYPDSAMLFAAQAMSLGRKVAYVPGQTQARLNEARAFIGQSKLDDAEAALKVCESEFAQNHDIQGVAACALADGEIQLKRKAWNAALLATHEADSVLLNDSILHPGPDLLRGRIFQELGSYEVANGYYQTALRIASMQGDPRGKALAAEALGGMLLLQGRNDSAQAQFSTAFDAWKAAGDRLGQASAFIGLGTAAGRAGKPEAALGYLRDAVELAHEDHAAQREGLALIRLAEAEVKLGLPDSAQRRCYDALLLLRNLPDPAPALDARIGIVQAALIRSDYARAQRHGDTAIAIADSFRLFRPLYTVNTLLSKAYQVTGDFRSAFSYLQRATTAKDSLQRQKERNQALANQVKLADEVAYIGQQESAEAQSAIRKMEMGLSRTQLALGLVFAAFLICLVAMIVFMLRSRKRGKQVTDLLARKEADLGETKQELSRVSARLQETDIDYDALVAERTETLQEAVESLISENEALQDFISHSANDLLGPMARLKGLVMVAKQSGQVKDFVQAIDLIDAVAIYTDKSLKKLLTVQSIKDGFRDIRPVNIEEIILDIRPLLKEIPGVKYPDVRFEDRLKRPVLVDAQLIRIILENLLENACVFRKDSAGDSPRIDVLLMKEDEDIYISIRDEGVGIPKDIKDKIFNLFFRGNERSKGHGLGLYLVAKALREIGGRIAVESREGAFAEFVVRFREGEV